MTADGVRFRVTDTQKKAGDLFVHLGTVEEGTLKAGAALQLEVDHARRTAIRANHSATHLLHEALRQVLGDHVAQKGSLVAPDRLRFDFSHPKPMTAEEIEKVEDIANDFVLQNSAVTTRLMALDDARASGARALFGEKYGDEVRVVAMGEGSGNTLGWSVELCGGTHVKRTGDIGLISGGVRFRRCGGRAPPRSADRHGGAQGRATRTMQAAQAIAADLLRVSLRTCRRASRSCSTSARSSSAISPTPRRSSRWAAAARPSGDDGMRDRRRHQAAGARGRPASTSRTCKSLADEGKKQVGSGVVALVATSEDGKGSIVVGVTPDLVSRFSAVDLVRKALRGAGRQGRRRQARHGAGRRARRLQGGCRAEGDRRPLGSAARI